MCRSPPSSAAPRWMRWYRCWGEPRAPGRRVRVERDHQTKRASGRAERGTVEPGGRRVRRVATVSKSLGRGVNSRMEQQVSGSDAAIGVESVERSFGEVKAWRGISFGVPAGSVLGVLGPNGAGKTTTVSVLSTLVKPDAGRATVAGFDVVTQAERVRESIMLTGQYAALDEMLT